MDFDVDKVTLLGSSFNRNGEYIGWSNFFDYDNIESLKLSETIPYPTGETLKVEVILDKNFEEPSIDDPIAIADYQNKLRAYNEAKQIALNKYNEIKPYIVSLVVGEANGKLSLVIDNDQLPPEEQLNNLRKLIKALKIIEANDFHIYIPEEVNNNPILKRRIDYFKNRIDEHNLYIANHKYLEENAAKNMISSTLIQISIDPSNLIQSQSSVALYPHRHK